MPPFNPIPRAVALLATHRNSFRQPTRNLLTCNQIRCLSCVAGNNVISSADKLTGGGYGNRSFLDCGNSSCISSMVFQKRGFLGCGDGEEDNALSKVHEERHVLGYSPEQMFNVVAAVDLYEDFLPWCQRSQIIRRNPDGSFDAELEIGFKFLVESYISHVELKRPNSIKTTSSQSSLFDHLINVWEFSPGPFPGSCTIYFLVDFKFQSPLYRQIDDFRAWVRQVCSGLPDSHVGFRFKSLAQTVEQIANMFFKEVFSRLVNSFSDRCRHIYGPGVPVIENSYEQNTR